MLAGCAAFHGFGGSPESTSSPLVPADFVPGDGPGAVKVLTRAQTAKVIDVPNGGQMSIWVKAPDGSVVEFGARPLLPDEAAAYPQS